MRDRMYHRGPDDAGLHVSGSVGLGHRRLSILDLTSAGHQPMTNEDGTLWLVFNGEIYNYLELRTGLVRRGHRFTSETDSEVILHLYEEDGGRCVEKLNGMFAFTIWDTRTQSLFGARDRTGIKPFNYHLGARQFICASEIKAILEDERVPRDPDPQYFADYLYAGYSLNGKTPLKHVQQLLPGHTMLLHDGRLQIQQYWDVKYEYNRSRSHTDVVEELRGLIDDAVRIHCRSDASLGCHLSGGLDSSTIVAFAAEHRQRLKTFSIRFDGDPFFDETSYAKAVARHSGTEYIEATPDAEDLSRLLPSLLWHLEVPMPTDGGFAYYAASELASRHVKVSLTGHGGDELFAGYPAQFQAAFESNVMFPGNGRPGEPAASRGGLPLREWFSLRGLQVLLDSGRRRLGGGGGSGLEQRWIDLHCGREPIRDFLLNSGFVRSLNGYSPMSDYIAPLRNASTHEALDRCLYHDLRTYLPALLHMEDRVSMAVSLESRVPLLDHRIIEFLATVPPEQKVPGLEPKALLRAAAGQYLPDVVSGRREKVNFPVPVRRWIENEMSLYTDSILRSDRCLDRGVLNPDWLRGPGSQHRRKWAALNMEMWFRIFIDQESHGFDEGSARPPALAERDLSAGASA